LEDLPLYFLVESIFISHDWQDETPEAKARWFQSLSVPERFDVFFNLMDVILEINPRLAESKDAQPVPGRVLVLELPGR
jgi:hypothetical protein